MPNFGFAFGKAFLTAANDASNGLRLIIESLLFQSCLRFSTLWKTFHPARAGFSTLWKKSAKVFPLRGKNPESFSIVWKNRPNFFHTVEKLAAHFSIRGGQYAHFSTLWKTFYPASAGFSTPWKNTFRTPAAIVSARGSRVWLVLVCWCRRLIRRISCGFWRRQNQPASFPRWRAATDRSRTRVQLGSSATRHHRKIHRLFWRDSPAKIRKKSSACTCCAQRTRPGRAFLQSRRLTTARAADLPVGRRCTGGGLLAFLSLL
ncbi:MAG: hypothetical protein KBF08_02575 [Kiritimatiellae bacterium]|nr:hypothetical protein [Kiritimatiellia bacterium]MBP9571929.1 hypothetical protein [Kiritimatiellia bacterium]HPK69894.1 hypothetical protein [Kiritimatiellia bacterium]